MRVLAIDTALDTCSACVFDAAENAILAEQSISMLRGHAEALIPLVERVVAAAGGFGSLNRIAVTTGPGSFTGLRVALSAGRSFALALKVPCVGVGTLAAIAAPLIAAANGSAIASAIDARHGHIYFELVNARGQSVVEARCVPIRDAARLLGGSAVTLAGPAAGLLAPEARTAGATYTVAEERQTPDIAWVARLGALADPAHAPARPTYLKPVDATPQTGGRIRRA